MAFSWDKLLIMEEMLVLILMVSRPEKRNRNAGTITPFNTGTLSNYVNIDSQLHDRPREKKGAKAFNVLIIFMQTTNDVMPQNKT